MDKNYTTGMQRRTNGDIALAIVVSELIVQGFDLFVPLTNNPDVDLVAKREAKVFTIQVKGRTPKNGRLAVQHKIKSWTNTKGLVKVKIEPTYDILAIVDLDSLKVGYYQRNEFMHVAVKDVKSTDLISHSVLSL